MINIKHYFSKPSTKLKSIPTPYLSTSVVNVGLSALILGLSLTLSGCGGGSSTETTSTPSVPAAEELPAETGQVMIVIRDDEEDFLSYDIEVLSIDLVKVDGTQVSVAPNTARVDFIQYTDLSELFSMNSIPAGRYNQISFTLDYSSASIIVQDEHGDSYQASAQNSDGDAITTFPLSLVLADDEPLVISKGKISALTLDLDLASSNQIVSFNPAIVQVEPFVNVTLGSDDEREHRARGLLQSVDSDNNTITLAVKPLRKKQGDFGELTLNVDETTLYEIDGEEVVNADALATLASLALDSPVVAFGEVTLVDDERSFIASKIVAGTSVAWAEQDTFRGVVTARSSDSITISGVVLAPDDRAALHSQALTLTYNEATQFTGFNQQSLSDSSLSVGQHVRALGDFDDEQTFNAGDGIVHIKLSQLTGQVVQISPLAIDVNKLNRKPIDSYDFTGTGLTTEQDADPNNYDITTNNLTIADLAAEDWLTVRGYVNDFAQAPDDFTAKSLIKKDIQNTIANFKAYWAAGTDSVTIDSDTNQINWDESNARQKMTLRGVPQNLANDKVVNSIISEVEQGRFAIKERGIGIHYYAIYNDFVSALNAELTAGKQVKQITSKGSYDESITGIKALAVSVIIQ